MKKLKLVSSIVLLVAVMAIAGFNVTKNKNANRVSDLALANVEALADTEGDPEIIEVHCWPKENATCITYQILQDGTAYQVEFHNASSTNPNPTPPTPPTDSIPTYRPV